MSLSPFPYRGARTTEEREIFRHGRLAGQRGQSPLDNPYTVNTAGWTLWRDGWRIGWYENGPGIGRRAP
jgi:hypothetical protein